MPITSSTAAGRAAIVPKLNTRAQHHGVVLVVEDETFVREVTAEILESAGYHVLKARSAAEALRAFAQCRGDVSLLLADIVLPGRNGLSLSRELRTQSADLKTLFMSGYPESLAAHQDGNGMSYLAKPFSVRTLLQKVKEVMEQEETTAGWRLT